MICKYRIIYLSKRSVGQPGRPLALGARCRKFESCHSDQITLCSEIEKSGRSRQPHKLEIVGSNPTLASI